MHHRTRRVGLFLLGGLLAATPGCLPSRFVIDLASSDGRLFEKQVLADDRIGEGAAKVALIDVSGVISHSPGGGLFVGRSNSVDELVSRLERAEQDPLVRAVVLRVNSPGGTVAASDTMHREILSFRARSKKPVVASMAEVAASGGYYISLAADHVMAQPSSVTGSIGVIIQTVNFSKGMAMIGVEARAVKSGSNKDLANPLEPMRDGQYAVLQGMVDDFYGGFRGLVSERRGIREDSKLDEIADGRVFTGRQALEHGLVDEVGDLRDAFARAKSFAKLDKARLVKYHEEGRAPSSAYASARGPEAAPESGTQVNLLQLNMGEGIAPSAGFYYLWWPGQ